VTDKRTDGCTQVLPEAYNIGDTDSRVAYTCADVHGALHYPHIIFIGVRNRRNAKYTSKAAAPSLMTVAAASAAAAAAVPKPRLLWTPVVRRER
jgi:hypothetical protein